MGFVDLVKARARADEKTIVLPESTGRRTWEVAETILKEGIASLTIIGTPEDTADHSKGLDVSGATMTDPQTYEKTQEYIDLLVELRKLRGMTPEKAEEITMSDYAYYGYPMIRNGDTDGLVSSICHSTTDALGPCPQTVKTELGTKLISVLFLMVAPGYEYGAGRTFIFADSGLNQNPNPEELAAIAKPSTDSFELLVQKEVKAVMLSHSVRGSTKYPDVDEIVEATRVARKLYPELKLDEEPQLDAAPVSEVASSKVPGSEVTGRVNVLMFPDLNADNIGCRLVQRLTKAEAYGSVTQGIAGPVNDLSRGCYVDDTVGVVVIAAVQVQTE